MSLYKLLFLGFFVLLIGIPAIGAHINKRLRSRRSAHQFWIAERAKGEILVVLSKERMTLLMLEKKLRRYPRSDLFRYLQQLQASNLVSSEEARPEDYVGATFFSTTETGKKLLLDMALGNGSSS